AGYHVRVLPLAAARPGESAARRINRALEEAIRERPEQYMWSYNRYKRPHGAPPPP
ncbi:MAG TPA: lysophospholipid acyltransferase family protein, partial [Burkholderiales bacterium]|nr:lysophospholipid acyltransferase family protein [Burkholderiales bacterium]